MSISNKDLKNLKNNEAKKRVIRNAITQARFQEVPMPLELMAQIFDETSKIGYETEPEREYRQKKEDYNEIILDKIKKLINKKRYGHNIFTDRQRQVFELMYIKGLTVTQAAKALGVSRQMTFKVKKELIVKMREAIVYDFNFSEKDLINQEDSN